MFQRNILCVENKFELEKGSAAADAMCFGRMIAQNVPLEHNPIFIFKDYPPNAPLAHTTFLNKTTLILLSLLKRAMHHA